MILAQEPPEIKRKLNAQDFHGAGFSWGRISVGQEFDGAGFQRAGF